MPNLSLTNWKTLAGARITNMMLGRTLPHGSSSYCAFSSISIIAPQGALIAIVQHKATTITPNHYNILNATRGNSRNKQTNATKPFANMYRLPCSNTTTLQIEQNIAHCETAHLHPPFFFQRYEYNALSYSVTTSEVFMS